jgi:manganese transport protein
VAAIAYVDPGNIATNAVAGSTRGFELIGVVLGASLMGIPVQALAAKVGLATGGDLASLCGRELPTVARVLLWVIAEIMVMATDVAEVLGASLGLSLLLGIGMLEAGVLAATASLALLALRRHRPRWFEAAMGMTIVILAALSMQQLLLAGHGTPTGTLSAGSAAVPGVAFLAAGIIGATVMPHAIFLQSALVTTHRRHRSPHSPRSAYRRAWVDIGVALGAAGLVNALMLVVAAVALNGRGASVANLTDAWERLRELAGPAAGHVFAIALVVSGLASASVGTLAGEIVMEGLLRRRVRPMTRRLVTLLPSVALLAAGVAVTPALIGSQVVLSLTLPCALVPLIWATHSRRLMGDLANRRVTTIAAVVGGSVVVGVAAWAVLGG